MKTATRLELLREEETRLARLLQASYTQGTTARMTDVELRLRAVRKQIAAYPSITGSSGTVFFGDMDDPKTPRFKVSNWKFTPKRTNDVGP